MRRHVRGKDEHVIEAERFARREGGVEVPEVDRVERAAEDRRCAGRRVHSAIRVGHAVPAARRLRRGRPPPSATPPRAAAAGRRPSPPTQRRAECRARRKCARSRSSRSGSSSASILFAATMTRLVGEPFARRVAPGKSASSRVITSKSSTGSRPADRRHVDDVHQHLGALEMAEETRAEPVPLVRPFDQPGHVGDDERAIAAQPDDAEVRHERGERIVGDLRPAAEMREIIVDLPAFGIADQPDVGQQLQVQPEILLFARQPRLRLARRAVGGGRVASRCRGRRGRPWRSGRAARRRSGRPPGTYSSSRRSYDDGADRHLRVRCRCRSCRSGCEPSPCPPRPASKIFWNRKLSRVLRLALATQVDRAARPAVAAVGTAARHELLAAEAERAPAAVSGRDVDFYFVDERHGTVGGAIGPVTRRRPGASAWTLLGCQPERC